MTPDPRWYAAVDKRITVRDLAGAADSVATFSPDATGMSVDQIVTRIRRELDLWHSPLMRNIAAIIAEAARVNLSVLITGETGTGKDFVARAIHYLSARRHAPFVRMNCTAVPNEVLASDLFGHEPGAFTGADRLAIGTLESAHGGTIFLAELGGLQADLQGKLLHVLQDGEVSRVGAKSPLKVDVRVIASTQQDLEHAVSAGRLREDLYYRLNVLQIALPPLRERPEDIPHLVQYFVELYATLFRRHGFIVPPEVMDRLVGYRFPGNVRELENVVKRMVVLGDPFLARVPLCADAPGEAASAPIPASHAQPPQPSLREIGRRAALTAQRDAIAGVLQDTAWNRVRAAKVLRVSYRALLYKMKETGLSDDGRRPRVTVPRRIRRKD